MHTPQVNFIFRKPKVRDVTKRSFITWHRSGVIVCADAQQAILIKVRPTQGRTL